MGSLAFAFSAAVRGMIPTRSHIQRDSAALDRRVVCDMVETMGRERLGDEVERLHRDNYRRLIAPLIRLLGSFEAAEDVVQDVFARALVRGLPDEPVAWLHRAARNRAIDQTRRHARWNDKQEAIAAELTSAYQIDDEPDALRDDTLRLVFTCCHPSLSPEAQIGLTLRTVCGLSSEQVARAFLIQTTTLQQRLVRAKQKIDRAGIPYAIPDAEQLPARLGSVLRTIYLVFNEGYGARDGATLIRRELCDEGVRLARLVVGLLPEASAAKALLALMLLHHSRSPARTGPGGDLITLEEQDRALWSTSLIEEALPLVEQALTARPVSTYAVEAAIAALHAKAVKAEDTDWPQIVALYEFLLRLSGDSPVVALNAAVAVAMAGDLEEGLRRLDVLDNGGQLGDYHLLPAAQADLLRRSGRIDDARAAFERARALVSNPVERRFIERKLASLPS